MNDRVKDAQQLTISRDLVPTWNKLLPAFFKSCVLSLGFRWRSDRVVVVVDADAGRDAETQNGADSERREQAKEKGMIGFLDCLTEFLLTILKTRWSQN